MLGALCERITVVGSAPCVGLRQCSAAPSCRTSIKKSLPATAEQRPQDLRRPAAIPLGAPVLPR